MPKRAIVSVAVSDVRIFKPYIQRFYRTMKQFGGADYLKIWHRALPPNAVSHREIHYGFKVHAVAEAAERGCDQILWFDCSCWAIKPLDKIWDRLDRDGYFFVEDANALGKWCSDHCLKQFNMSRDDAMNLRLLCGTAWGLDLRKPRSVDFLNLLRAYARPENFNGTHVPRQPGAPPPQTEGQQMSNDPRCLGHRSDEAYLSLLINDLGLKAGPPNEFAGGNTPTADTCVLSGYNLVTEGVAGHLSSEGIIVYDDIGVP